MSDYKKIAMLAINKASENKNKIRNILSESVLYPENIKERMHPAIEKEIRMQKHSLGKHPAFPEEDECSFEEKIMGKRFGEVVKRYKKAFDVDNVNDFNMGNIIGMVEDTMIMESKHKKKLEKLAVKMVREEFDISEDILDIVAELTPNISLKGTKLNPTPSAVDGMKFDTHEDIRKANAEVYKRRLLNAMTQGAAKKCHHMFHMVDEELTDMDPQLLNRYNKLMAAADYSYYMMPNLKNSGAVSGGVVKVELPTEANPKAVIHAQAVVFPVLIHEIVKGVMEILSAHGLPKNTKLAKYVINKADFLNAELSDMRLGPALWGKFSECFEPDDYKLKHHVYSQLAELPADEFHSQMREILAGTKMGKQIVKDIVNEVNNDIHSEEFEEAMKKYGGDEEESTDIEDYL